MKKLLYFSLLCLAAAGCSEESTVPEPAPAPAAKSVGEIRIETENNTELWTFFYDEHQHIQRQIITRSDNDTGLSNEIYEYRYTPGRIDADHTFYGQTTRLSFLLDGTGYCVEALDSGQPWYSPKYNANGYYYEEPAEGRWGIYEYHMVSDRCDLYKIVQGYGSGSSDTQSSLRYEAVFTYETTANDANLDLFYLVARELYSAHLQPGNPMLFGWMGKRNSRLPKTVEVTSYDPTGTTHSVYTYAYETDSEGRVEKITESLEGQRNTTYRITYRQRLA